MHLFRSQWLLATIAPLVALVVVSGCSGEAPAPAAGADAAAVAARGPVPDRPVVVFLGDSLTAGYGLDPDQAFPAVLGRLLAAEGAPVTVVNAGVSGDTSAGGLRRVDWVLSQKPDVLVVALGGNDGLRGLPVDELERNLDAIVAAGKRAGARVLLAGMVVPPNMGPAYFEAFRGVYGRVAEKHDVPLVPFLLEGVGGVAQLNQDDGIHPTAEGHERIARTLRPELERLVRAVERVP